MEGMTRAQHYQRAQELLEYVESQARGAERPRLTEADLERLAVAQVHATLAAAPADVAGETQELVMELGPVLEAPGPDVMVDRLEAALEEMLTQADGRPVSAKWAASFIRERVLGLETGR